MNVAEWLVRNARRLPDAPTLLAGEQIVADYAQCARRAATIATTLRERRGIAASDRVALVMSNRVEYLELMYARTGARCLTVKPARS